MSRGSLIFIFIVSLVSGILIYNNQYLPAKKMASPSPTPYVSIDVTQHGEYVCLPHKDKSGPQTLECALGLKSHDGDYYSLDTSAVDQEYMQSLPAGSHIYVEGTFVPVEALSSDHWQIYDIKGIIKADYLTLHDY